MRLRTGFVALLLGLGLVGQATATDVGLNLGDDTAELNLRQELSVRSPDETRVGASLLFNEVGDVIGSGYIQVLGDLQPGFQALSYGAGIKGYGARLDDADTTLGAVGLGGMLRLDIPQTSIPMALVVEGYVAPDITTSGRGEGLVDLMARYEFRFARSASAYIGYRYMEIDLGGASDYEVDDDFLVGIRLSF